MAYCSVCGIHYQTDTLVCAGCGSILAVEVKQEHRIHPVSGESAIYDGAPINDFCGSGMQASQDPESQLGKGLIKPHSIELDIDGFHFKYDKPVRNFAKLEKAKEKVVEFRVTCPEPASELSPAETSREEPLSKEIIQEEILHKRAQVHDNQQNIETEEIIEAEAAEVSGIVGSKDAEDINISPEKNDQLTDEGMWVAGEILIEKVMESPLEPELISEFDLPEPELQTDEEMVILWEDFQRWFGIPLTNQYRISNRSLQITDRLALKFSEIDLPMISEVTLQQSWLGKLFNTGDLMISVKHLPDTRLKLAGVRNPEKVHCLLEDLIKNTRLIARE